MAEPLQEFLPYGGTAFAAVIVAHFLLRIPGATLENLWLDALNTKFALSLLYPASLMILAMGVARSYFDQKQHDALWTALIGSLSVVLGLASKDVLGNFAAGVVLVFSRPFAVGDQISVGGTTGIVTEVIMTSTTVVTSDNEGVCIPNKAVMGSVLQNNSYSYNVPVTPSLRQVTIQLWLSVTADLEKGIEALERAAKVVDTFLNTLNRDPQKQKFRSGGVQTLAEYHKRKYGTDLMEEQKANPTVVFVGGQHADKGHYIELRAFADNILYWAVFQKAYREAIKALSDARVERFDPSVQHH